MSKLDRLIEELCPNGVEYRELEKITDVNLGRRVTKAEIENNPGNYPVWHGGETPMGYINKTNCPANTVIVANTGSIGYVNWLSVDSWCSDASSIIETKEGLSSRYIYHFLKDNEYLLQNYRRIGGVPTLELRKLKSFPVPLPPLPVQEEIVRILDNFTELTTELTAELTAREKQYEYYRDELLTFGDEVEWKTLEEVCTSISAGGDLPNKYSKGQESPSKKYQYPIYSNAIEKDGLYGYTDSYRIDSEAVTVSARETIGFHTTRKAKFTPIVRLITLIADTEKITTNYLNYSLFVAGIEGITTGIPSLTVPMIKKFKIPIPPLDQQERIVSILDKFDALVNDISIGLPAEIEARQKQYEYYREKLLTFKELDKREA